MSDTKSEKEDLTVDGLTAPERSEKVNGDVVGDRQDATDVDVSQRAALNAVFENPLAGVDKETLIQNVRDFCHEHELDEHVDTMIKGALASQSPWGELILTPAPK
jgi:hypothetical protein